MAFNSVDLTFNKQKTAVCPFRQTAVLASNPTHHQVAPPGFEPEPTDPESGVSGLRTLQIKAFCEAPEPACTSACTNLTAASDTRGSETLPRRARKAGAKSVVPVGATEPPGVRPALTLAAEPPVVPGAMLPSARLSFADVVAGIVALPLTAAEKAEAVRRLLAVRSQ